MRSRKHQIPPPNSVRASSVNFQPTWYGDGDPTWTERAGTPWQRLCRTAAEAQALRHRWVKLLRRHGKGSREAISLADRIECCAPRQRCESGACPECSRAHQRWFVATAGKQLRSASEDGATQMVSVVPDFGRFMLSELGVLDIRRATRTSLRLLKSAGVRLALGATDFSMNIDVAGTMPYLQVQLTLFTPWRKGLADHNLRQVLNTTGTVKRPIRVQKFDGDNAGLAYAVKYEFVLRETYFQDICSRSDGRSCQNTRNRPLRGKKWLTMMLLMDRIGLHGRLALLGARRIRQDGSLSMRLLE
jgi:hypothetical protein